MTDFDEMKTMVCEERVGNVFEQPDRHDLVRDLAAKAISVLATRTSVSETRVEARIEKLADAFLSFDPEDAKEMIDRILRDGVAADAIIDFVLPDVARKLGDRWFADNISFVDVSIGTARLQETIRDLRAGDQKRRMPLVDDARVLLIIPGPEDHTLGVFIAADQLRRQGLIVDISVGERKHELVRRLTDKTYQMAGITASGVRTLASVRELVTVIRRSSPRFVPIALGGAILETNKIGVESLPIDHYGTDICVAARRFGLLLDETGKNENMSGWRS